MLTPEDIEQKTFSTALRGYDLNEVDDFLDEIMATIRDLNEQLEAARSGQPAGAAPAAVDAPATADAAPAPVVDESAVGRALIAAQEAADRIVSEANAEAEQIRESARVEADSWKSEREEARAAAEKEMADLSGRVDSVRRELAVLATGVADSLDRMDQVISEAQDSASAEEDADGADAVVPRHAAASSWSEDLDHDGGDFGEDSYDSDDAGYSTDSAETADSPDDGSDDEDDDDSEDSPDEGSYYDSGDEEPSF